MNEMTPLTLETFNNAPVPEAMHWLEGVYAQNWVLAQTLPARPFASVAALVHALTATVSRVDAAQQMALIGAYAASADQAMQAALAHLQTIGAATAEQVAQINVQREAYAARFGSPYVVALPGPRGTGLGVRAIADTLVRRLRSHPDAERSEALRHIHRLAELCLQKKFAQDASLGRATWDGIEALSQFSEAPAGDARPLTVTYLTDAHRACMLHIADHMRASGFDSVTVDAVGNVVGIYCSADPHARSLMTGSHYDTVRNAGRYDGRLGIYAPITYVAQLAQQGRRLPFHLEVVAFAEEEGQRYEAEFLASHALIGGFQADWMALTDAAGVTLQAAMAQAGAPISTDLADIARIKRDPSQYLGFIEIHIEQGPVLNGLNLPLGVVTSIYGSARGQGYIQGLASHAGTTPMDQRRDAVAAIAELVSYVEQRAAQDGDSVGTVGMLLVPNGSPNVIPGRCHFSLDLRAPNNAQRDALKRDVLAFLEDLCERRGVSYALDLAMDVSAAVSAPDWQARWERAVAQLGLPVFCMPSGAGHDAMILHKVMPQAMLFVRGENGGISHNPLESTTAEDMDLAVRALGHLVEELACDDLG